MTRRKTDPLAQAIRDLKYLERVAKALDVLDAERARVAALTARIASPALTFNPKKDYAVATISNADLEADALARAWMANKDTQAGVRATEERLRRRLEGQPETDPLVLAGAGGVTNSSGAPLNPPPPRNPILDTPERREYEEAKKAGRTVPVEDPLKNATDAQRERMAEQRALVQRLREQRGMPPSRQELRAAIPQGFIQQEEEVAVRTEELPTSANGSAGAEEEPVHG